MPLPGIVLDNALGAAAIGGENTTHHTLSLNPSAAVPTATPPDNELIVVLTESYVERGTPVPFADSQGNTYHALVSGEFLATNPTTALTTADTFSTGSTGSFDSFVNPAGIVAASFKGLRAGAATTAYGVRHIAVPYGSPLSVSTTSSVRKGDLVVVGYSALTSSFSTGGGPTVTQPAGWTALGEARAYNGITHYSTYGMAYKVPTAAGVVTWTTTISPAAVQGADPPDTQVFMIAAFPALGGGLTFWM